MRKVTGQSRREYNLDQKTKKTLGDGEIYKVEASNNLYVKLLNDCSKAKQQELEGILRGETSYSIMDAVKDIAYSRGSFVGYVYQHIEPSEEMNFFDTELESPVKTEPVSTKKRKEAPKSAFETAPVKIGLYALLVILIGVLNIYVLYEKYLELIAVSFDMTILKGCSLLGLQGATSLVVGLGFAVFMLVLFNKNGKGLGTVPFLITGTLCFAAGILLTDFIIAVIVLLVCGAVSLIKALLPTVIAIAVVWLLVKYIFKSFFRR